MCVGVFISPALLGAGLSLAVHRSWLSMITGFCGVVLSLGGCWFQLRLPTSVVVVVGCLLGQNDWVGWPTGEGWGKASGTSKVDGEGQIWLLQVSSSLG